MQWLSFSYIYLLQVHSSSPQTQQFSSLIYNRKITRHPRPPLLFRISTPHIVPIRPHNCARPSELIIVRIEKSCFARILRRFLSDRSSFFGELDARFVSGGGGFLGAGAARFGGRAAGAGAEEGAEGEGEVVLEEGHTAEERVDDWLGFVSTWNLWVLECVAYQATAEDADV